jgi:hypothetical protein
MRRGKTEDQILYVFTQYQALQAGQLRSLFGRPEEAANALRIGDRPSADSVAVSRSVLLPRREQHLLVFQPALPNHLVFFA